MKDDLIEIPQFIEHGEEDFTFRNDVIQDVTGILEQNKKERDASNGFTDKRTMRKIASIPVVDWYWALEHGYHIEDPDPYIRQKEIYRYLRDKGKDTGVQTVNHISTPGYTGHIIVK
jgi:hypothetical protein